MTRLKFIKAQVTASLNTCASGDSHFKLGKYSEAIEDFTCSIFFLTNSSNLPLEDKYDYLSKAYNYRSECYHKLKVNESKSIADILLSLEYDNKLDSIKHFINRE